MVPQSQRTKVPSTGYLCTPPESALRTPNTKRLTRLSKRAVSGLCLRRVRRKDAHHDHLYISCSASCRPTRHKCSRCLQDESRRQRSPAVSHLRPNLHRHRRPSCCAEPSTLLSSDRRYDGGLQNTQCDLAKRCLTRTRSCGSLEGGPALPPRARTAPTIHVLHFHSNARLGSSQ